MRDTGQQLGELSRATRKFCAARLAFNRITKQQRWTRTRARRANYWAKVYHRAKAEYTALVDELQNDIHELGREVRREAYALAMRRRLEKGKQL